MSLIKKIALGTAQFGMNYGISNVVGKTSFDEACKVFTYAESIGINTLDTANKYLDSEKVIGEVGLSHWNIISKYPEVNNEEELLSSINGSLKLLNTNSIYGYLAHNSITLKECPELWVSLNHLKEKLIVKKIGFSVYDPQEIDEMYGLGFFPDIIQLPYNLLDRRFERYFPMLRERKCEIHVRSIFLQGLFFIASKQLNSFFSPIHGLLRNIRSCFGSNAELASAIVKWTCNNPSIDKVVFGVNNMKQLKSNIELMDQTDSTPLSAIRFPSIDPIFINPSKWKNYG
jgi:aryl-alcohol dehydrogenase-like predicted oxidoreductase